MNLLSLGVCASLVITSVAMAQPANDHCANATVVVGGQSYAGSNLGATSDIFQTCSARDNVDVWYRFTAAAAGAHAVSVTSPNWLLDTTVAVYVGCEGPRIACNDDADPFYGTDSLVVFPLAAGQQIAIRVAGYDLGEGPFNLIVVPPPAPSPTGACCMGSTCNVTTPEACSTPGHRFAGSGATCNTTGNTAVPCCLADFNQDGFLSITDLFAFLNAWVGADPLAQFHGSNGLTTQNILDFIAAWYNGC